MHIASSIILGIIYKDRVYDPSSFRVLRQDPKLKAEDLS